MKIHGLQKMTLLDYPGRVACTVFLATCDFRCPFCHNWELIDGSAQPECDEETLMKYLESRTGILDGVCITGGEPTLYKELPELLKKIKELGYPVKLDTNGYSPEVLRTLFDRKLIDYVAMDIKNCEAKYAQTVGLDTIDITRIEESIRLIMVNAPDYEFRTTVVNELHDEDSFRGIAHMINGANRYYLQAFADRDTVPFAGLHAPESAQMRAYAAILRPFVKEIGIRGVD